MRARTNTFLGGAALVAAVGVLAGCGAGTATTAGSSAPTWPGGSAGSGTHVPASAGVAHAVLLSSVQRTSSQPFQADLVMDLVMSSPGTAAESGFPGTAHVNLHLAVQSEQLLQETMTATVSGHSTAAQGILAGGRLYLSSDGGKTWTGQPAPTTNFGFGPDSALQFLNAVGTVSDKGAGTADGVSVEQYQATLDPSKLQTASAGLFSQLGGGATLPAASDFLHSLTGVLSAVVDSAGRLVTESCTVNATMQLPGFGAPGSAPIAFSLHEAVQGHFYGYGSVVAIQAPPAAHVRSPVFSPISSSPTVHTSISSSLPAPQ